MIDIHHNQEELTPTGDNLLEDKEPFDGNKFHSHLV